jgi:hypothetical protein
MNPLALIILVVLVCALLSWGAIVLDEKLTERETKRRDE